GAVRAAGWGPIARSADRSGPTFALWRLDAERVAALRAWGHTHGMRVNDLLLAALYEALFATLGAPTGHPLTVGVPIDLRRYLPPGQHLPVCNLSNSTDVAIVRQSGATFTDILGQVHQAMQAIKSSPRGLTFAAMAELLAWPGAALMRSWLEQLVRHLPPTSSTKPFLSNVGVIDEQLVDFGEVRVVDAYGLGPVSYPPGLLITVSTFRGVMTLAIGFCASATERQLVEQLLDRVAENLPV
ncbi:MAG: WS/DGAT domain-containing protein, partial [Chloroflexaceae bacterium]|nr:WS/DGAT domain-containing protein [Chloroflexaceae bacterium]